MARAGVHRLAPEKQARYAGMDGLDDAARIFDNAETLADARRSDPVLGYLYAHARSPRLGREAWAREVLVASSLETLLQDFFYDLPQVLDPLFDLTGQTEALRAMSSPRGVVALNFQGGFLTLLRQFFTRFVDDGVMIDRKTRIKLRSLGAIHPGAALFGALRAVEEGRTVCIAPDGGFGKPIGPIQVLGASCPVADGAAFLAYESGCDTVWYGIRRRGRIFVPVAQPGPRREPSETFGDFRSRLFGFYRDRIEAHFTEDPQSLALTSVWRERLRQAMEREMPTMVAAPLRYIGRKRQQLYAGLTRPDDTNLILENAEKVADVHKPDPMLDYLYDHARAPKAPREIWIKKALVASCFEYLLEDFFARRSPSDLREMFDPPASALAVRALSSPRGVLALTSHAGFAALLPQFFVEFLDDSVVIEPAARPMHRSLGADNPGAALFGALHALREGRSVYVAPDGHLGKPSGHIQVLGVNRPVFDGAPFLAYESGCDTVWYGMRRSGPLLAPVVEPGPTRAPDDTFKAFRARLIEFYRSKIEEQLTGDPENLAVDKSWRRMLTELIKEKPVFDERSEDVTSMRSSS